MQEFIEAAGLLFYIRNGTLIPLEVLQKRLTFSNELQVQIPVNEYLLGIADLTGELMRMCINSVGRGNIDTCFHAGDFLRKTHEALSSLKLVQIRTLNSLL